MRGTQRLLPALAACLLIPGAQAAQVFVTDVVIQGSACVGFDCVNGESFGSDTIRLKENNLRIHFLDTSNSGSFPSTDWRLTANDSANGGANRFSIEDASASRTPFTIEGSAPNHSLYVDDGGRIGVGKNTPVVEVHVADGDTPTLRLEQDGSSGFTPQTWDVAGNEAGFFVRDTTNGSKLSFRIKPGAPKSSIHVAANGDVGFNNETPDAALDVVRSTGAFSTMLEMTNNSGVGFSLNNTAGDAVFVSVNNLANSFTVNFADGDGAELALDPAGNLTGVTSCSGCAAPSDRNIKENFAQVDQKDVLQRLVGLDVTAWNYKEIDPATRHIGPMSQDFHAAFQVGGETTIHPVDTFGVTAAAIQALHGEVQELRDLVKAQQALIEELR